MKVTLHTSPFHFVLVDNLYDENELALIWKELDFLHSSRHGSLLKPELTQTATDPDGKILKNNIGNFLDDFYTKREYSNILQVNRKIFHPDIMSRDDSWFFNQSFTTDGTLISYYENGGYYKPHNDTTIVTACTWFWKEPKKFTGGNFRFPTYDIQIEIQNNSAVVFPSHIIHEVENVSIDEEHCNNGYGRFCMSQFIDRCRPQS